jgi:hypothetical protein
MSKQLSSFLDKIDEGKAVNLKTFLKTIERVGLNAIDIKNSFLLERFKGDLYYVSFKEPVICEQLHKVALNKTETHISAARQNNSHSYRVDYSFLLARKQNNHPYVITFDEDGQYFSPKNNTYSKLLVIENLSCFMNIEKSIEFLQSNCDYSHDSDTCIVFGAGNQINNELHEKFLKSFLQVDLFLDIDVGGLIIAKTLASTCQSSVRFMTPLNIEERLKNVEIGLDEKQREYVFSTGNNTPFLTNICSIMHKTNRSIEQQSFIYER